MSAMLVWVVGGGGLLGSHLRRALRRHVPNARVWESTPPHLSWTDAIKLTIELDGAVAAFADAVRRGADTWSVLWCAGRGVMSSTPEALEPEWSAWKQLLELLGYHLAGSKEEVYGSIFLASSAGGVYGSNVGQNLTEHTPTRPASHYGAHKIRMEEALRNWSDAFPRHSCLIGRISSLYGPGQDLSKAQGIISHLSRCLIYHQSVSIYVPLDTRRDYLFADDCAHQVAAGLRRLLVQRPRILIKIFSSEELTSLSRIVGIFFRLAKNRPLVVLRQPREPQPISLTFRSANWGDLKSVQKTDLAAGIHAVHEYQLAAFRRGQLPPP